MPPQRRMPSSLRALLQDPDTYEPSAQEMKAMRIGPGRPLGRGTKTQVTIRLDTAIVEKFKATGDGGRPASTPCCAMPWRGGS